MTVTFLTSSGEVLDMIPVIGAIALKMPLK